MTFKEKDSFVCKIEAMVTQKEKIKTKDIRGSEIEEDKKEEREKKYSLKKKGSE